MNTSLLDANSHCNDHIVSKHIFVCVITNRTVESEDRSPDLDYLSRL